MRRSCLSIHHRPAVLISTLLAALMLMPGGATAKPTKQLAKPPTKQIAQQPTKQPSQKPLISQQTAFSIWVRYFRPIALKQGIKGKTFDRAFKGVRYNKRVIELDNYQPEFVQPIGKYVRARTTKDTIQRGRKKLATYPRTFAAIERKYKVSRFVVAAIWRLESNYGENYGSFNVFEALATLAFAGRRKGFWQDELVNALRIVQRGDVPVGRMVGSWAGAMGHTQFIPSSYLRRAVDGNGDGKRDLWRVSDAMASTANYLAKAGWQNSARWGYEVRLPKGFNFANAAPKIRKSLAAWSALGIRTVGGKRLTGTTPASLLMPSGHQGPVFLVTKNYRAILRYNNASAYALSVLLLADRLAGRAGTRTPWPLNDRLLTRGQKEELQRRLTALGFSTGGVDGKIGPDSRAAIRRFQASRRLPADGYANYKLLEAVRRANP